MTKDPLETQPFGRAGVVRAFKRCFETDDGKAVLRHLIRKFHVLDSTFTAGDPHLTAMMEGERRVVLSILRWAKKDFTKILSEIENATNDQDLQNG